MPKVCPVCATVYPDLNVFCPVDGSTLHVVDLEGGLIGSVVADRYLVTDLLGEGGMGKVYLARHVRLPQKAAIKVLRRDMVRDPAAVARFNREASNASQIDDEHVARVFDFGEATGGTVYLAMEYVPGPTLKELLARDGALAPRRAADIISQVAQGLDAAHRLKIIHRDLKPDNILIIEGPDGVNRVKVVDFGIAKAFGAGDGNLTKTGFVVGTPEFMSPEQLMGATLDARSDVYALALVAFQCLTNALPFRGDTPEMAMTARLTAQPCRLEEIAPAQSWPAAVQAVFDSGLSREVAQRPESAGAFARLLSEAIEKTWVAGKEDGPAAAAPAVSQKARAVSVEGPVIQRARNRWTAMAGVAAVLAVAGFLGYRYLQGGVAPGGTPASTDTAGTGITAVRPPAAIDTAAALPVTSAAPPETAQVGVSTPDPGAKAAPTAPQPPVTRPQAGTGAAGRGAGTQAPQRPAADSGGRVATPPAAVQPPPAPVVDPALRETLDSLTFVVRSRGVDAAAARAVSSALRSLIQRLEGSERARAQLRLIDASVLSGDMAGACSALAGARASATTAAQRAEVQKYQDQLGCG